MALTVAEATEYRLLLTEINRMAQRDLVSLWRLFSDRSRNEFFASLMAGSSDVVALYRAMAAETAGLFYEETQGLEFVPSTQNLVLAPNVEQLERNLRWAYYGAQSANSLSLVSGIVQKHVVNGSRDYGIEVMRSEVWMRDARPGACTFCRLLATRGVQDKSTGRFTDGFTSDDAAAVKGGGSRVRAGVADGGQASGDAFHENCMCLPVLQSEYDVPSHVEEWLAQYNEAYSAVGDASDLSAVLSEMRRLSGHSH